MTINLKQPRYVVPAILLPFILLLFYTYKTSFGKTRLEQQSRDSLQDNVADVSSQVKKSTLTDKLNAYRERYRRSDGYSAIAKIQEDTIIAQATASRYNEKEKQVLDSIEKVVRRKYYGSGSSGPPGHMDKGFPGAGQLRKRKPAVSPDQALADALNKIRHPAQSQTGPDGIGKPADPMQLFRQQMSLIDSMGKAHDPAYQAAQQRRQGEIQNEMEQKTQKTLPVSKVNRASALFNTITPQQQDGFITAIIDQDITGYAGSRLRIRLLDDMLVGKFVIKRGTYLYAQISGFSGQRVRLSINSIMQPGHMLPVKLELYDEDGLPGLYVPASAFRDFTRELGSGAAGGLTLQQQADNNSQMVMSVVQRMFESTTTAVSNLIKQNKAKIKYNTLVFLVDPEELRNQIN